MRVTTLVGLGMMLIAGCGSSEKVLIDVTFEVSLEGKKVAFDSPKEPLKVKIEVNAGELINVYLCKEEDAGAVIRDAKAGVVTARVLAYKEKETHLVLEHNLPAHAKMAVLVMRAADKSTNARVRVTSKK